MDYRLLRPSAAFLPAALLAAHFLGADGQAEDLWLSYLLLQLFALCPAEAFRNAAARETGFKRVDRRFGAALMQLLIGCALTGAAICWLGRGMSREINVIYSFDPWSLFTVFGAAACIIIEQMFEERLYAVGRAMDGAILSAVSAVLLLTGMLLDASGSIAFADCTLCAAGLGALIGLIFTLSAQPFKAFSLVPRNYGFVPKALVQFMLYPAAWAAADLFLIEVPFAAAAAGWLLWRLARSYARRTADESRPLDLFLTAVCAALIIGVDLYWPLQPYAICATAALICAEIVFLAPSLRLYLGTVMLAGALLIMGAAPYAYYISVLLCLAAVVLNLKNAFLQKNPRSL